MAGIAEVCSMVERMADGFEDEVMKCLSGRTGLVEDAVREQLFSGLDGQDKLLSPTYDEDPYFTRPGPWQGRGEAYKKWKADITPPCPGAMILTPPRPLNVPNLYINGKFFSEIFAEYSEGTLSVKVDGNGAGPDIVAKYGEDILRLGPTAVGWFNEKIIIPRIWEFFSECGY